MEELEKRVDTLEKRLTKLSASEKAKAAALQQIANLGGRQGAIAREALK